MCHVHKDILDKLVVKKLMAEFILKTNKSLFGVWQSETGPFVLLFHFFTIVQLFPLWNWKKCHNLLLL